MIERYPTEYPNSFYPKNYQDYYSTKPCIGVIEVSETEVRDSYGPLFAVSGAGAALSLTSTTASPIVGEAAERYLNKLQAADRGQVRSCLAIHFSDSECRSERIKDRIQHFIEIKRLIDLPRQTSNRAEDFVRRLDLDLAHSLYMRKYEC